MEEKLIEQYGYWGEHPDFKVHEWQYHVSEDYTRLGYWAWVIEQINDRDT